MSLSALRIAALLGRDVPTPDQIDIIESPLAPLLVVAGAGSGKTETMAARVVWLIANGLVAPEQVLGLTFTRKAAGELGDRVRLRLRRLAPELTRVAPVAEVGSSFSRGSGPGRALARPTVATYNSYAASLVTDHALRIGIEPTSRLLRDAGQWQLASAVVDTWAGDLATDAATSSVTSAVLELSGALAEHLVPPDEAGDRIDVLIEQLLGVPDAPGKRGPYAATRRVVASLAERRRLLDLVVEYRRRKRAADLLDFGDQVQIAARLAREVDAVRIAERSRFRVVLLDEYQDTSHAQLELLSALFGGGHPVTAVGDPHQSIYGWRGASAGGIERFPDRFPVLTDGSESPAPVRYLSTSWRNDRAILDAANRIAAPLRTRLVARGGRTAAAAPMQVPRLEPRPGAGPGVVRALYVATVEDEAAAVTRIVARTDGVHPIQAYTELCRLVGQLAIFGTERAIPELPEYRHEELGPCFFDLKKLLDQLLNMIGADRKFQQRPFSGHGLQMRVDMDEPWLAPNWQMFVGVESNLNSNEVIGLLTSGQMNMKIASTDRVEDVYALGQRGMIFRYEAQPPRVLPITKRDTYFSLERTPDEWPSVQKTRRMAIRLNERLLDGDLQNKRDVLIRGQPGKQPVMRFTLYVVPPKS